MDSIAQALDFAIPTSRAPTIAASPTDIPAAPQWQPTADTSDPTVAKACRFLSAFIAAIRAGKKPGKWLTLSGVSGTGKTMLATQAFAEVRSFAFSYAFVRERDFDSELRGGNWTIARMFERMDFVVFDDLGSTRDTSGLLANAIAEFVAVRERRWTLWTTNLPLDSDDPSEATVKRIDPRIASRLIRDGNRFVRIEAEDYALRTRKAKDAA